MSIAELERMLDRWDADPAFRDAVRRDPVGAIARAGFTLADDEWAAVEQTDWHLPEEELRGRLANVSASPPA
jgi:hypothetical protein